MDKIQKFQLFNEVLSGNRPATDLSDHLADEHNWIAEAVNHIVQQRLQQSAANKRLFRLKFSERVPSDTMEDFDTEVVDLDGSKRKVLGKRAVTQEKIEYSDWYPEDSQFSAPMMVSQMRIVRPHSAISIERENG